MVKFGLPAGGSGAAAPLCATAPTPFPSASSSQLQSSLSRVPVTVPPAWPHMNTDCGLTTQQGNARMTNTDMHSSNTCCHRQAYAACVFVALVIQHAKRMCRVVLSCVAGLAPQYFSALSHKRYDFRGKKKVT
jgi:hypothetical protein